MDLKLSDVTKIVLGIEQIMIYFVFTENKTKKTKNKIIAISLCTLLEGAFVAEW